jgi:putative hemolysin
MPRLLARLGALELRLAVTRREIRQAQKLRWQVFYQQGQAHLDRKSLIRRRDICPFDRLCDHLIVVDTQAQSKRGRRKPRVVGTYRLLLQSIAEAHSGFYSASEFGVDGLVSRHPGMNFLELGRSCILPEYRARRALELLWRGLWMYARHHNIDVMIGCASMNGVQVETHRNILSHIHDRALARGQWRVAPLAGVNRPISEFKTPCPVTGDDPAVITMPPLIKGYLRLGARFGEGIFVDRQFGTTDVLVILPVSQINRRYIEYFSAQIEPRDHAAG